MNYIKIVFLFLLFSNLCFAQQFSIEGKVFGETKEKPLSFANIRVLNTTFGASCNVEGSYNIRLNAGKYELVTSYIGYISDTLTITLSGNIKDADFILKPTSLHTPEVTILPGKNPALEIIQKTIVKKNKRIEQLNSFEFFASTKGIIRSDQKLEFDDNSISLGAGKSSDTSKLIIHGILENQSRGYFKKPDNYKEFIIAQKQTANLPNSINILTGGRIIQNFYTNDLNFFSRPLLSPIADNALNYYYYFIYDTLAIDNNKVFQIYFEPDYRSDPGFVGYLYIADSTYNLLKIDAHLNRAANVGGLFDSVRVFQQFVPYDGDIYMPIDYRLFLKANILGLARIGLELNTILYDYKINQNPSNDIFDKAILTVEPGADKKDSTYWKNSLSIPTTKEEITAYKTIDSLKSIKTSFWDSFPGNLLNTELSINNNFSINAPLSMYHFNRVEGHSLDFGVYARDIFNRRLNSDLHLSYGFSDKKYKTDFSGSYLLGDYRTYKISLNVFNKLNILFTESDEYNDLTSSVLALFTKYEYRDYYYTKGFDFKISGEVLPILNMGIGFISHNDKSANVNTNYSFFARNKKYKENKPVYEANINALNINFDFDFRDFIEDGYFRQRVTQGKSFIKFGGNFLLSDSKALNSNVDFRQYSIYSDGTINTFKSAKLIYKISHLVSSGPIPFQMMYSLSGNINAVSKNWTFRTVGVNEYFGDKATTLFIEHNFGDELFRLMRIPKIQDLEIQLTGYFNAGWIDVSEKSQRILPVKYKSLIKPLMEAGFSIGHVLFPMRLEFTWRLNYTEENNFVIGLNTFIF